MKEPDQSKRPSAPQGGEIEVPAALARGLERTFGPDPRAGKDAGRAPAEVGLRVRAMAQQRLAELEAVGASPAKAKDLRRAARRGRRRLAWAAGLAAAALLLAFLRIGERLGMPFGMGFEKRQAESISQALPGDVDQSGRIDILDAFLLARELRGANAPSSATGRRDATEDGVVDERDVERIARLSVRLER